GEAPGLGEREGRRGEGQRGGQGDQGEHEGGAHEGLLSWGGAPPSSRSAPALRTYLALIVCAPAPEGGARCEEQARAGREAPTLLDVLDHGVEAAVPELGQADVETVVPGLGCHALVTPGGARQGLEVERRARGVGA